MTRDERGSIRVFAVTECVGFPRVREHVCVSVGVSVENAPDRIITGDVWVKTCISVADFRGGGGTGRGRRRWGLRACNHTSRGNSRPRWGRGAGGAGGATLTLSDRSRREALIGETLLSSAEEVGKVATMDCTVASWVVTVSSCLVIDASTFSEEHMNGMRMHSLSDRSLSCLSSGMGI